MARRSSHPLPSSRARADRDRDRVTPCQSCDAPATDTRRTFRPDQSHAQWSPTRSRAFLDYVFISGSVMPLGDRRCRGASVSAHERRRLRLAHHVHSCRARSSIARAFTQARDFGPQLGLRGLARRSCTLCPQLPVKIPYAQPPALATTRPLNSSADAARTFASTASLSSSGVVEASRPFNRHFPRLPRCAVTGVFAMRRAAHRPV